MSKMCDSIKHCYFILFFADLKKMTFESMPLEIWKLYEAWKLAKKRYPVCVGHFYET